MAISSRSCETALSFLHDEIPLTTLARDHSGPFVRSFPLRRAVWLGEPHTSSDSISEQTAETETRPEAGEARDLYGRGWRRAGRSRDDLPRPPLRARAPTPGTTSVCVGAP
jgi:hypothetical protein